jgi:hypothetical protein
MTMLFKFSSSKQPRAKKTLENLLETADQIVTQADIEEFNSRHLAKKSGYALGTLSKRLGSTPNAFLWAIAKTRNLHFSNLAKQISHFDPKLPIQDFLEFCTDESFNKISSVTKGVMRYYDENFPKKYGLTTDYFDYFDVLAQAYLKACLHNETGTFRTMSFDEARLIFKALGTLLERPFANLDPIAGTKEHRRIIIENGVRLLAQSPTSAIEKI